MTRINPIGVNKHMSYTIKELSDLLNVDKKTILRWISQGLKIVDGSRRPILINGSDLKEFVKAKDAKKKITMNRNQFYCLSCKKPVYAKRGSILKSKDRKIARCRVCNGKIIRII